MSHEFFVGEMSPRVHSGTLKCCTGMAQSRGQHTLRGNNLAGIAQTGRSQQDTNRNKSGKRNNTKHEHRKQQRVTSKGSPESQQDTNRNKSGRRNNTKHEHRKQKRVTSKGSPESQARARHCILAEGAIALSVTLSGGALFAS